MAIKIGGGIRRRRLVVVWTPVIIGALFVVIGFLGIYYEIDKAVLLAAVSSSRDKPRRDEERLSTLSSPTNSPSVVPPTTTTTSPPPSSLSAPTTLAPSPSPTTTAPSPSPTTPKPSSAKPTIQEEEQQSILQFVPDDNKPFLYQPPKTVNHISNNNTNYCVVFSCSGSNYSLVDTYWQASNTSICHRYHFYGTTFRFSRNDDYYISDIDDDDDDDDDDAGRRVLNQTNGIEVAPNWCRVPLMHNQTSELSRFETVIYTDVDVVFDEKAMLDLAETAKKNQRMKHYGHDNNNITDDQQQLQQPEHWLWLITAKEERGNHVMRTSSFIIPRFAAAHSIIDLWASYSHQSYNLDQDVFNNVFMCGNNAAPEHRLSRSPVVQERSKGIHCYDTRGEGQLLGEVVHCGHRKEKRVGCMLGFDRHPLRFVSLQPPVMRKPTSSSSSSSSMDASHDINCVIFSCSSPSSDNTNNSALLVEASFKASPTTHCHRYHFYGTTYANEQQDPVHPDWCHMALLDDLSYDLPSPLAGFETVIFVPLDVVFDEATKLNITQVAKNQLDKALEHDPNDQYDNDLYLRYDFAQQWTWVGVWKDPSIRTESFILPRVSMARSLIRAWTSWWWRTERNPESTPTPETVFNMLCSCSKPSIQDHSIITGQKAVHCLKEDEVMMGDLHRLEIDNLQS